MEEASGSSELESMGNVRAHGANGREQSAEGGHDDAKQDAPRGDRMRQDKTIDQFRHGGVVDG